MKRILILLFLLLPLYLLAQKPKAAASVTFAERVKAGDAIVYASFIQRLGFSSGGFPQEVVVQHIETNEVFAIRVKPAYKSAKEYTFCNHLKPGNYVIVSYLWTKSKWYGGTSYGEPIFKNVDASTLEYNQKLKSGQLKKEELVRFTFTVAPDTITYLGTWHFDNPIASFSNEKAVADEKIKKRFKNIDFSTAVVSIPE